MKILFFFFLLLSLTGFAQFPQCLMPGNSLGKIEDDTLLNKRSVLLNAGVKKIYARQAYRESLKISKTTLINETGSIQSIASCFSKDERIDSWCVFDTIIYDDHGRNNQIQSRDGNGYEVSQAIIEYIGKDELRVTTKFNRQGNQWDSLIDYRYFDKKGQMVKLIQIIKGRPPETSLYYYNTDGLLDSVQYENSRSSTIIYKRNEKGKKKIIEAEIQFSKFRWIFNQSGQCICTAITTTSLPGSNNTNIIKSKIEYHYNPEGTLSKVTLKRNNEIKAMMYYTYSK